MNNEDKEKKPTEEPSVGLVAEFTAEELNSGDLRLKLFNFLNDKEFDAKDETQYSSPW